MTVQLVPQLRFSSFNDIWKLEEIGNVLKIQSGKGFKANEYTETGVPLIQIENVAYGSIKWNDSAYLPEKYIDQHPNLLLKLDDIVIALNRPVTNGQLKIAKLSKEDCPSILYQRVGKLIFIDKAVDKEYVFQPKDIQFSEAMISNYMWLNIPVDLYIKFKYACHKLSNQ